MSIHVLTVRNGDCVRLPGEKSVPGAALVRGEEVEAVGGEHRQAGHGRPGQVDLQQRQHPAGGRPWQQSGET